MKRLSFAPAFLIYTAALLLCLGLRVWLKLLGHIDLRTGFYTGARLAEAAFNFTLCGAVLSLFLIYLLRRSGGDYPLLRRNAAVPSLFAVLGLAILLFTLEIFDVLPFENQNPGLVMERAAKITCGALGLLAGLGALLTGVQGVAEGRMRGGVSPLSAGIWMLAMLVCRFNGYTTLTTISDNLLTVLFMLFCAVFFVGHARTLSGFSRRDGRNYVIPAGLCASLFGFLLVLPNWAWLAAHRSLQLPAPLLGGMESLFVFMASLYALAFVRSTCRSIGAV